jgi:DNA-binding transcriptional LysR family regulator
MSRIGNRGELEAFVRSVETGSFSAAARELKLTPSGISKLVTRLERALKARLVSRSTRRIVPTPEGELFMARCRRILAELEDAETEVGRSRDRPRGRLRMHMGVGFGMSQGVKALPRFFERYPEVELDLHIEDRRVDLFRENFDISTWSFPPSGARLVARKLFEFRRVLCASPEYLASHGMPRTPDDLSRHRCLLVSGVPEQSPWVFEMAAGRRMFDVEPAVSVNSADCKYRFTLAGMGIAQFSEYIVADALRDGRLVQLLPDCHAPGSLAQYAVYPHERHRLPRVAAMLDFLVETFASRPWRDADKKKGSVVSLPTARERRPAARAMSGRR